MNPIIFIGGARDYHAIDWYRAIKQVCDSREIIFATDLITSEGYPKLVNDDDHIIHLFNIDRLLFSKQSKVGNVWRNLVKLVLFPLQLLYVKKIHKAYPDSVFHAHTMYYMFLCWLAGIRFIGTPQGSEILVRPHRSKMYRLFATKSLLAAEHIIVDSYSLQNGILNLCGKKSVVIQNGIDSTTIFQNITNQVPRTKIVSIRGLYPLYRIHEILKARDRCRQRPSLVLFYPFAEEGYRETILQSLDEKDLDLGRIPAKSDMYKLLDSTLLAISVPESDSSPRTVYEAIFSGCCVAVTYNPWINTLPDCMKARLCVVDLDDYQWLEKAIDSARLITKTPYFPSEMALEMYDQLRSMRKVAELFYDYRDDSPFCPHNDAGQATTTARG